MTNSSREQMEKAFSMGEANVALEGFDVHAHPLYATLKAKVLSGEMTPSEMSDAGIAYVVREQAKRSAA